MTMSFSDVLDIALARTTAGEDVTIILADYAEFAAELQPLLETVSMLDGLKPVAMPSEAELAADRTAFLQTMEKSVAPGVSFLPLKRLTQWIGQYFPKKNNPQPVKKEKPMFQSLVFKASLILMTVFGSAGGTALVAAQSLPDSVLYPVKLAMEDAQLQFVDTPSAKAMLHLNFAQERVQEMVELAANGVPVDETVVDLMQQHLNLALQLAEQSPEPQRSGVLLHAQEMLQQQQQQLGQLGDGTMSDGGLMSAEMAIERAQERMGNVMPPSTMPTTMPSPVSPIATPMMTPNPTEMPGGGGGMPGGGMQNPTAMPTSMPTMMPNPTEMPGGGGGGMPGGGMQNPTAMPTSMPTMMPNPTEMPGGGGGGMPGGGMQNPTAMPTSMPTTMPSPTEMPGGGGGGMPGGGMQNPTAVPTVMPTTMPSPTEMPSGGGGGMQNPTAVPTAVPTAMPTPNPTGMPGGGGGGMPGGGMSNGQ